MSIANGSFRRCKYPLTNAFLHPSVRQSRRRSTASTYDVDATDLTPLSTTDSNVDSDRKKAIDHLTDTLKLFYDVKDDWDGNYAKAPNASLVRYAIFFVSTFTKLDSEAEIPIDASVAPDGAIVFEFENDNIELEIKPDFDIYLRYFTENGSGSTKLNPDSN